MVRIHPTEENLIEGSIQILVISTFWVLKGLTIRMYLRFVFELDKADWFVEASTVVCMRAIQKSSTLPSFDNLNYPNIFTKYND